MYIIITSMYLCVCAIGMTAWKSWAATVPTTIDPTSSSASSSTTTTRKLFLHMINSSSRYEAPENAIKEDSDLLVVKTPKAEANFLSLRDFETQKLIAYKMAMQKICSPESDIFFGRYR